MLKAHRRCTPTIQLCADQEGGGSRPINIAARKWVQHPHPVFTDLNAYSPTYGSLRESLGADGVAVFDCCTDSIQSMAGCRLRLRIRNMTLVWKNAAA